jgi:predicted Fe-Mo cluster-binding NifX family protein
MKIVISATGKELISEVDPRFGRAAYFLIIDSESGSILEAIDNSAGRDAAQGAGISAAALVADRGVGAILTGRVGPKAMPIVEKAGIQVVSDVSGTVGEAVEKFRSGAQGQTQSGAASSAPTAPGGKCRGCGGGGQGKGLGKGQGQGGGRGSGSGGGKGQNRK